MFDFLFVRFLESLLRQASNSLIVHCPTLHCFVNQSTDNEQSFRAEEYSDVAGQTQSSLLFITVSNHFVSHCSLLLLGFIEIKKYFERREMNEGNEGKWEF